MTKVREIWPKDADPELIAPLLSFYPRHITVGTSESLAFSAPLYVINPDAVYDKIDYREREEMTGEELYAETREAIAGGFKGGQIYNDAQTNLMIAYNATINPPELP